MNTTHENFMAQQSFSLSRYMLLFLEMNICGQDHVCVIALLDTYSLIHTEHNYSAIFVSREEL
jgi:hypothetical protein